MVQFPRGNLLARDNTWKNYFSSPEAEKSCKAQLLLPKSKRELNVGKSEDTSVEVFISQWPGVKVSVTHKDKMEERK